MRKLIDIGANLTDGMFQGIYNGKTKHLVDLSHVIKRAQDAGVSKCIVTAGNLEEGKNALELVRNYDGMFTTIGVHPTRCGEFVNVNNKTHDEEYMKSLKEVLMDGMKDKKIVAIGECGLDYDRTNFCDIETQKKYFEYQFQLAELSNLNMFLHLRGKDDCFNDFVDIIKRNRHRFSQGVVHSFDGSVEQANVIVNDLNLYIGVNGCSLKTEDNLKVVKMIPNDRLMIETDAPWCGVKQTHAGNRFIRTQFPTIKKPENNMDGSSCVKDRNEPCHLINILEIIASVKEMDIAELESIIYRNTNSVFFP